MESVVNICYFNGKEAEGDYHSRSLYSQTNSSHSHNLHIEYRTLC